MVRVALGFVSILAISAGATLTVQAQVLATPAEFPPTSYNGTQYVDSKGCAFVRAGRGGLTNWVPRVDRTRAQLCGFQPTQISASATTSAASGPIITFADVPEARVVPAPAAARVIPASAPAQVAAPAAPAPRRITLAEVCEGKFGIQAGFATANGNPINCGPAPVAAPVAAPIAAPFPLPAPLLAPAPAPVVAAPAPTPRITLAQACNGRFGIQAGFINGSTGQPIDCGLAQAPATPTPAVIAAVAPVVDEGPRRVTLTQICTEIAATGRRFINAATGSPVVCPSAPAPVAVASVASNVAPRAASTTTSAAPVARETSLFGAVVPASNPAPEAVREQVIQPPAGYTRVWDDNRINQNRGLRRITREQAISEGLVPAPATAARASSRSVAPATVRAPAAAASTHRYVQVGSFGDAANANRLAGQFQARGWPVTFSNGTLGGKAVKIVILGPFTQPAQLQTGLQAARTAGFGDAFTRN